MFSHYFWKLGTNYPLQVVHIIKSIQTQNCELTKQDKIWCLNLSTAKELDIIKSYVHVIIFPKWQVFKHNWITSTGNLNSQIKGNEIWNSNNPEKKNSVAIIHFKIIMMKKKNVIIQKDQFLEKILNGFFGKTNFFRKPVQIYEQWSCRQKSKNFASQTEYKMKQI